MTEALVEVGRGVTLAYETFGDASGEPMLLVAGLGMQMHSYDDALCELFAARGYRVIRFDNRDVGRSTHFRFRPAMPWQLLRGRTGPEQYDLGDMAADAVGLLDALGIERVHLVGVSMGGMIAQTIAARYPDRVRSLTSIMSTTGGRKVGRPAASTYRLMFSAPPKHREAAVARGVRMFRHIGSAGYPFDEAMVAEAAGRAWDRDPGNAAGVGRQLGAIVKSADRAAELRGVTAPTLVMHGDRDRMVHPTGGAATAAAIPGARLVTLRGMGHDLPRDVWPRLVELIDEHARAAIATG
ncbi:MAG: alpha/beta fold hydrolase [Jatrophihabitans sp.]|uniref:alpha/beta fold hydrolase n=1 Tax=Jatrophihabitans sp. TaxID=1932789 RepID=UPI003F803B5C